MLISLFMVLITCAASLGSLMSKLAAMTTGAATVQLPHTQFEHLTDVPVAAVPTSPTLPSFSVFSSVAPISWSHQMALISDPDIRVARADSPELLGSGESMLGEMRFDA
jgi:hypothetical protein